MTMNWLITLAATAITFLIIGVWLMAVLATAAMSHSQRWMQGKVIYWQTRAMKAEDAEWRHVA